jgi:hypothetical protein
MLERLLTRWITYILRESSRKQGYGTEYGRHNTRVNTVLLRHVREARWRDTFVLWSKASGLLMSPPTAG